MAFLYWSNLALKYDQPSSDVSSVNSGLLAFSALALVRGALCLASTWIRSRPRYVSRLSITNTSSHPAYSHCRVVGAISSSCDSESLPSLSSSTALSAPFTTAPSMMLVLSNESQPSSFHFQDNMHKAILI